MAPVRALLQRLGPFEEAAVPVRVARGDRLDQHELVARLVALGYRREYQVEHRGELAVRGGIVDVYPSTAELPVRIDLWGDEVDRLTEFDPGDQRSVADLAEIELFGCREVLPTEDVRARAAALVGAEPWGRSQWERLAEGQIFDGMESWLPWLVDDERVLPDLVGSGGRIVLVDPRRIRDRAAELNDEEAALAGALAVTWGVVQSADAGGTDGTTEADPSGALPPPERRLRAPARALGGARAVDGAGGRLARHPGRRGARHRARARRPGPAGGAPVGAGGGGLLGDGVRRGRGLGVASGGRAGRGGHGRPRRRRRRRDRGLGAGSATGST